MSKTPRGRHAKGREKGRDKHGDDHDDKHEALCYKVLSADQCKELLTLSVEDMQVKMCEIFKLTNHRTDLKDAAILDYYTSAVWWGKEQEFNVQQLSGFFTVVHMSLENVKEKQLTLVENLKEFKKTLIGIGLDEGPSGGLDFFDTIQAKSVTDYMYTSFFQHYKLYEFMFSRTQAEEIIGTDLDIEVAKPADLPFPPPMDEGVSEEIYNTYIAPPPPPPESEVEEAAEEGEKSADLETAELPDIFNELTADDVREVIESVAKDMLGGLQNDVAAKLRDKENQIIQRINKIHNVAAT